MRQFPAILFLVVAGAGCSWIYNPNSIGQPSDAKQFHDGTAIDAPIDAPLVRDADPSMLTLIDVAPTTIYGGQGVDDSRPATLVIHGHNFIDGFTVDIEPSTGLHVIGTPARSFDGDYIAVQVEADVISGSGTADVPLTITVTEPGAPPAMLTTLTLTNLPTLETTTLDYLALATKTYARIAIPSGAVTFDDPADAQRVMLTSISSITIGGTLGAGGASASGTAAAAGGPGGCAGGALGAPGGCTSAPGGGGGATGTSGGGGGGFFQTGMPGGGGILGGAQHGNAAILNYDADNLGHTQNQSSGGGGGAGGSLASGGGGGGGGGGGEVVLTAGGDITVGTIDASGGTGGGGSGGLVSATGGGGGGTGGVIVIRSAAGVLHATALVTSGGGGGAGGKPLAGNAGGAGGPGAAGRIRTDVPTLPTTTGSPPHRNPIFDAAMSTVFTTVNPTITMHGTSGEVVDLTEYDFDGSNHDGEPKGVTFDVVGTLTAQVSLRDGYNKLCATLRDGAAGTDLADTCIVVVYLP